MLTNGLINVCVIFIYIVFHHIIIIANADKCVTPNGETADCVSIYKCPIVLEGVKSQNETSIDFAKKSQCGYDSDPLVCCGKSNKFLSLPTDMLPDRRYCGYQHSDDYLRDTENQTSSINEFPWLAALFYKKKDGQERNLCVGSLISNRYVLTAAHCVYPQSIYKLDRIRLGEYNIRQIQDCISSGDLRECSDPTVDFMIEETIGHPTFKDEIHKDDVALIRLKGKVQFSDYIRPICLPLPGTPYPNPGDTLYQSGWGTRVYIGEQVSVKKRIASKLVPISECANVFKKLRYKILDSQMCTKAVFENSAVEYFGDSGAPVMYAKGIQWFQQGIVAFGYQCGSDFPDVHVKVSDYVPWIINNMKS